MQTARLMIAAPQGRSGKTAVAIGLCASLRERGLRVKPFKKGPDYIDPSWLSAAAGIPCSNLDLFMFEPSSLLRSYREGCQTADLALIEASMGLFDSPLDDGEGSSAWLARELQTPIILIVNCSRMTRSAAAMVSGYLNFEPSTPIAGVILNYVGNSRHELTITRAIEQHCGIPVLGALPRDERLAIRERHLGIVPLQEQAEAAAMIDRIGSAIKQYVDIKRLLSIAGGSGSSTCISRRSSNPVIVRVAASKPSGQAGVKIGLLADRAFSFYYPENLDALERNGAQLVYIDSFTDKHLPPVDALYIGGGFPELYAGELEANIGLRHDIKAGVESGLPVYAECAGLIYLCRSLLTGSKSYNMCGVIPEDVVIEKRPQGHGYVSAEVTGINPFFPTGTKLKGHEFHHSRLLHSSVQPCAYRLTRGNGIDGKNDGLVYKNVLASYMHLHALGVPAWAKNFVKLAAADKKIDKNITVISGGY